MHVDLVTRKVGSWKSLDRLLRRIESGDELRPDWIELKADVDPGRLDKKAWADWLVRLHAGVKRGIKTPHAKIKGRKKHLLSYLYLLRAVAIALFLFIPASTTTVLAFSVAMGLLWLSTVPLTSGLVAQIFGVRYMGTLFGIVFFSHQIGSFLGVWLGGKLYDTTGSYDGIWWAGIALGIGAAILHWPIDDKQVDRLAEAKA